MKKIAVLYYIQLVNQRLHSWKMNLKYLQNVIGYGNQWESISSSKRTEPRILKHYSHKCNGNICKVDFKDFQYVNLLIRSINQHCKNHNLHHEKRKNYVTKIRCCNRKRIEGKGKEEGEERRTGRGTGSWKGLWNPPFLSFTGKGDDYFQSAALRVNVPPLSLSRRKCVLLWGN